MSLRFERIAAFAALLLFAIAAQAQNQPSSAAQTPLTPQEIAALEQDMVRARSEEKWVELYRDALKLHRQRPYTPDYYMEIIRASAALDRRRTAYHFMLQMQQQGHRGHRQQGQGEHQRELGDLLQVFLAENVVQGRQHECAGDQARHVRIHDDLDAPVNVLIWIDEKLLEAFQRFYVWCFKRS